MQPTVTLTDEEEQGQKLPQPESRLRRRPRKRKRLRLSFLLAGIAILGAVIYLVVSNTQASAVYYMTVSELKSCKTCVTQDVRVAGVVQSGFVRNDAQQTISFVITQGSQKLPVTYTGVVPDIFAPGITVVVEGYYTGSGPFQAQTLLAKCPSKFQAATPTP
jgi:cytochrome c-type biogenesis protein CcmE